MLKRLFIGNYALIDHLDIGFPDGLVIVTGETGAGKSILLGAISLALGGRSDVSTLMDPSRNCVVEAVFEQDGNERIFRRVVSPQGRSRGFIDDVPVTAEQMRSEAAALVDVHSQNQQLLLSEKDFQRTVLDSYAGITSGVERHGSLWQEFQDTEKTLAGLDAGIAEASRQKDYMEFQLRQLEEAALKEGEVEELEEEQQRLAHAESVKEQMERVDSLFEDESVSMESRLKEMTSALDRIIPYFPEFEEYRARLESARIELKDIHGEIASRSERVVFSPDRLEEVENRLALLYGLMRKFGVRTVSELISLRDSISARLDAGADRQIERDRLSRRLEELREEVRLSADSLRKARLKAAPGLSSLLQEQVRWLEMPRARFTVEVRDRGRIAADGGDDVVFLFDANDRGMQPLSKCASGGELSRIMLCIKALLARYRGMPTLVFDEIDSGVSGSVAGKMGRMIASMGERMQIFAITHLPQVASKGEAHFLVYKEAGPSGMSTAIRRLEGEDRVREIARMLSGENVTPEALANAGVLLQENKSNN